MWLINGAWSVSLTGCPCTNFAFHAGAITPCAITPLTHSSSELAVDSSPSFATSSSTEQGLSVPSWVLCLVYAFNAQPDTSATDRENRIEEEFKLNAIHPPTKVGGFPASFCKLD